MIKKVHLVGGGLLSLAGLWGFAGASGCQFDEQGRCVKMTPYGASTP